jgi:hypothetical protein
MLHYTINSANTYDYRTKQSNSGVFRLLRLLVTRAGSKVPCGVILAVVKRSYFGGVEWYSNYEFEFEAFPD